MSSTLLTESPWCARSSDPEVFVEQGGPPYECVRRALSHVPLERARGLRVLVKPNGGRIAASGSGIVTDATVVAAVIDAFLEVGAKVSVGDSPITGIRHHQALEASGVVEVARKRACQLVELDAGRPVEIAVPEGRALRELKVCRAVLEHELLVSVPVMKTHMHTGVTLAVKNMKGCLWRRSKVDLHMLPPALGCADKPLDVAITDLATVMLPHLSVVDGTIGLEGLGPSAGQPKPLGAVVVGAEAFAVDAVCCGLMGLSALDIPHLRLGAERGLGTVDLARIRVSPSDWERFAQPFARPPANLSIQFPGVEIRDEQSCSACQSTLLLFLKRYGSRLRDYFPEGEPVHILIGKGHDSAPQRALCIGNCTAKHRGSTIYVSGCPPVGSSIFRALAGEGGDNED